MRDQRSDAAARADIRNMLQTSARMFGVAASRKYNALLDRALTLLRENPTRPGVQQRDDLPSNYYLFHLRHARTRGASPKQARHFILFRFDDQRLYILRVLHAAMDIEQNVADDHSEP